MLKRAIVLAASLSLLLTQGAVFAEPPLWWKVGVMADQMFESSPVEAIKYYKQAVTESKSAKADPRVIAAQIFALGNAQYFEGKLADSIQTFKSGVSLALENKLPEWQAEFLLHIGLSQKYQINYGLIDKADPAPLLEALKLRPGKEGVPSEFRIGCYEALVDIYRGLKDYASAERYLNLALAECQLLGDEDYHIADFTLEKSLLKYRQGKIEEAKCLLSLACKIHPGQLSHYTGEYIEIAENSYSAVLKPIAKLIETGNIAALEKIADLIRSRQELNSSGYLQMHDFYYSCGITGLDEDEVQKRISFVRNWVKKYPQSSTAKILLAQILSDYAWEARGTGYANTVSREGWAQFSQRLKEAWTQLEAVKNRPADWYRWALRVGLGEGWSRQRYEQIYSECRKKYPKVDEVIWSKAMWLQPKWHGELGESDALLNAELHKRSGVAADVFYTQTVLAVDGASMATLDSLNWQRMRRGFEEIIRRYPKDDEMKASYLSHALAYNDPATLKALGITDKYLPPPSVHDMSLVKSDFCMAELEKRRVSESDLERLNRVIKENPASWEGYYNRGQHYSKEDKRNEAISDFSKAIELSPEYSGQALIARCDMYKMLAKYDESLADAEAFQKRYPTSPAGLRNHGEAFNAMENFPKAVKDLEECLSNSPADLTALESLTLTYDGWGKIEKAIEMGSRYVFMEEQTDRDNQYFALQDRALVYVHANEIDLALEDLRRAMLVKPKHSQIWAYLAFAMAKKNDLQKALEAMKICEKLDTFAPRARRLRAEVYRAAGKWKDALVDYKESTTMEPDYGPGFMQKAIAEIALGEYDDAVDDLNTALKRIPASAHCHALLAVMYDQIGKKEEAKKSLERAFELTPGYAPNLVASARIHLHDGDLEAAAKDCNDALKLDPFLAESYALASEIYDSCGDDESSTKFLELAHSMGWRDLEKDLAKAPRKAGLKVNIAVPTKPDLNAAVLAGIKAAGEAAPGR